MRTVGPEAIRAGEAYIAIGADLGALQKGLAAVQMQIMAMGKQLALTGAFLSAPFFLGAKAAITFEESMAKVSTMLDASTSKFLPAFGSAIKSLSVAVGESTGVLADAMYDILSAQISAKDATGVMEAAAKAAVAGASDTATATRTIVTLLKAYGLEASRAADMSDLLFSIIWRGRGTLSDFAPAIDMTAASAASAGLKMEELAAALASMTRQGTPIRIAATALRSTLMAFLKPTDRARKAAKSFGLELSTATIRSLGLIGVIRRLSQATPELVAEIIPNRRALIGLCSILQDTAGYYRDVELMTDRAGRTQEAFEKRAATTGFALSRLKQGVIAVFRELGMHLLPAIRDIALALMPWLQGIGDWLGKHPRLIGSIAAITTGMLGAGVALVGVAIALKTLTFMFGPTGAIGLILAALVLVLEAFGVLDTGFTKFVGSIRIGTFKIESWLTGMILGLSMEWEQFCADLASGFDRVVTAIDVGLLHISWAFAQGILYWQQEFRTFWTDLQSGWDNAITWMAKAAVKIKFEGAEQEEWLAALEDMRLERNKELYDKLEKDEAAYLERVDSVNKRADEMIDERKKKFFDRNTARYVALQKKLEILGLAMKAVFEEDLADASEEGKKRMQDLQDALAKLNAEVEMPRMPGFGGGAQRGVVEVGAYLSSVRARTGMMPLAKTEAYWMQLLAYQERIADGVETDTEEGGFV